MIETKLWERLQDVEETTKIVTDKKTGESKEIKMPVDVKAFTMLLKEIRETNRQRAEMLGLTKEAIEQMAFADSYSTVGFRFKVETYERTRRIASMMMDMVEREMSVKVIDHEPTN